MTQDKILAWPDRLKIRDTALHDDMGGGGQRIYTTAGRGYERREYLRATPAREAADDMLEALRGLMDLNDNGGPFGGEIYQDRIDRAWNTARDAIARATGGAAMEGGEANG